MNGNDMHRIVGNVTVGKATRESLAALHRQQQATPPGTASELLRAGRAAAEQRETRLFPTAPRRTHA